MKTLFVTIEEFLNNGGVLTPGRIIYREETRHFHYDKNPFLENSLYLGEYIGEDEKTGSFLIKNNTYKSFPITGANGFVKIHAKPLYKDYLANYNLIECADVLLAEAIQYVEFCERTPSRKNNNSFYLTFKKIVDRATKK